MIRFSIFPPKLGTPLYSNQAVANFERGTFFDSALPATQFKHLLPAESKINSSNHCIIPKSIAKSINHKTEMTEIKNCNLKKKRKTKRKEKKRKTKEQRKEEEFFIHLE